MRVKVLTPQGWLELNDAMTVVVEDRAGNPTLIASRWGRGGEFAVSCVDCPDFNRVLAMAGIRREVVVENPLARMKPDHQLPLLLS